MTELEKLHLRVKSQRRELRRLNKFYRMYWNGFYRGMNAVETEALRIKISAVATEILRGKMIKAFGKPAVSAAEHECLITEDKK